MAGRLRPSEVAVDHATYVVVVLAHQVPHQALRHAAAGLLHQQEELQLRDGSFGSNHSELLPVPPFDRSAHVQTDLNMCVMGDLPPAPLYWVELAGLLGAHERPEVLHHVLLHLKRPVAAVLVEDDPGFVALGQVRLHVLQELECVVPAGPLGLHEDGPREGVAHGAEDGAPAPALSRLVHGDGARLLLPGALVALPRVEGGLVEVDLEDRQI